MMLVLQARPKTISLEQLFHIAAVEATDLALDGDVLLILTDSNSVASLEALLAPHADLARQEAQWADWGSSWRARVRPFQVEGLWIAPDGVPCPTPCLRIDSSFGFGSGHHPTTRLCLERLGALLPVSSMLDVGTGTGILALFALKLGTPRVIAVDTDSEALRLSEHNRQLNRLTGLTLHDDPETLAPEQFPLVVANILAAPLMGLARTLAPKVASGGTLLLSGIRADEALELTRTYRNLGFGVPVIHSLGNWVSLELVAGW